MTPDTVLLEFVGSLREAGVQVSLSEIEDALRAVSLVPLESRDSLRWALLTTLVKSEKDVLPFDDVFRTFFEGSGAARETLDEETDGGQPLLSMEELRAMLPSILSSATDDELMAFASMVAAGAASRPAAGGGGGGRGPLSRMAGAGYYLFQAMQELTFREVAAEVEAMAASGELLTDVPGQLAAESVRDRAGRLRDEIERQIRRRIEARKGKSLPRKPRQGPEDVDFVSANLDQVEDMRRVLPPLARRLAARLARKQGVRKRGRVDIRRTLRHSMSTGGVPMDLQYRRKIPARPELFILCDISGSVRTFSTFTLQLVYSLHQQFRSVRSFVFIDRVDEVSRIFDTLDVGEAVEQAYRTANVVDGDGHSDVGRALAHFEEEFAETLTPRSTVLVLSDARNNGMETRVEVLERLTRTARRLYWLNPEPTVKWDTSDSVISEYQPHCHAVFECRNLKQLADFVYRGAS